MKIRIRHHRLVMLSGLFVIALCPALAGRASAACFSTPSEKALAAPRFSFSTQAASAAKLDDRDKSASIVGLWNSEFLLGDGPARFDQAFQIIHADGTEMMVSNGLPPSLGNVCVGIWKQISSRTYKLKHMTWNWDGNGGFAGTFLMTVTITLDRRGHRFAGTWVADSFDTNGQLIPELHAEGTARGERIGLD